MELLERFGLPWLRCPGAGSLLQSALRNARAAAAEISADVEDRRGLTPPWDLHETPSQEGPAGADRTLVRLPKRECFELLRSRKVGRLAFMGRAGVPLIVPVNYHLDGADLYIRSGPGPKLQAAERQELVSFEIDDIDEVTHRGWSVVVTGGAERLGWSHDGYRIPEPLESKLPQVWASGPRGHVMRVKIARISGRRLVDSAELAGESVARPGGSGRTSRP